MARLKVSRGSWTSRSLLGISVPLIAFILAACSQSLAIKDDLEQKVAAAIAATKSALVVYDGTTKIVSGGTAIWPNTIFGTGSTKTFTIKNEGGASLALSAGPNYVASTGGAGQGAYGSIVQPTTIVLAPSSSTTFSATFTPPSPDTDYPVAFVINSDDPAHPSFVLNGAGHSTQWHGSRPIISTATLSVYYSPRIAIAPTSLWASSSQPTLFAAYYNGSGIYISISRDGGKTWPAPQLAVSSTTVTAFSLGVSTNVHLLFLDSSSATLKYTISSASSLINSTQPDYTGFFSTSYVGSTTGNLPNSSFYEVKNSNMVTANNNVYIAFYNTTGSMLQIAWRYDQIPNMGTPEFNVYSVTGVNSKTGGDYPSLQVDSTNAYISYGDGQYTRVAVVPLLTISTASSYKYYLNSNNGTGYSLWSSGLAIDGAKGYSLWRLNDGSFDSAVSSDSTLSSWSSATVLSGEGTGTLSQAPEVPFITSNGVLYALYYAYDGGGAGIRLSSSTTGGSSWSGQWIDSNSSYASVGSEVAITAAGSVIYALYTTASTAHPNKYSLTLIKSLDGGTTW